VLATYIWAWSEYHVQSLLLRESEKFSDIISILEIPLAGSGFDIIPENVAKHSIEAHGPCHLQSLTPIGAWDALWVHLTTNNLIGITIEEERTVVVGETRSRGNEGEDREE
jgi:hypothetical protein